MKKIYELQELIDAGRSYTMLYNYSDRLVHTHKFWELIYQISGTSENIVNGKKYVLYAGEVLLMKPTDKHLIIHKEKSLVRDVYASNEKMQSIFAHFSIDFNEIFSQSNEPLKFSMDTSAILSLEERFLIYSIEHERNSWLDDIHTSAIIYILGFYVSNKLQQANPVPRWINNLIQNFSSNDYLASNVNEIIKTTNYSYGHVAREFKKYMGVSLKNYMMRIKLNRACGTLKATNRSISSIGEELGFESVNGFIQAFTAVYKCTPKQYRAKNSGQPTAPTPSETTALPNEQENQ